MFKKWRRNTLVLGMALLPLSLAISCGQAIDDNANVTKYKFDGMTFDSQSSLKSYLKQNNISSIYKTETGDYSALRWKLDGYDQIFNTLEELKQYIDNEYIEPTYARIILDGPMMDAFNNEQTQKLLNDIPPNTVIPLTTNDQNELVNPDEGLAYIYRGYDDKIYFTTNLAQRKAREEAAKRSWVEVVSAYEFNGIYFDSFENLEYYLSQTFQTEALNADSFEELKNYQLVMDGNNGTQDIKIAHTIWTKKEKSGLVLPNEDQIDTIVENSIMQNSDLALQVKSTDEKGGESFTYLTFNDINANDFKAEKLKTNLNYWNIGAQNGESFYIVDNEKDSRGELFGPYFVESPEDIGQPGAPNKSAEGVMDKKRWKSLSASEAESQLQSSFDVNGKLIGTLISTTFTRIKATLTDTTDVADGAEEEYAKKQEIGLEDLIAYAKKNRLFDTSEHQINLGVQDFFDYLNNIKPSNNIYAKLGTQLLAMDQSLTSGKRYNPFYLLPVTRNYIISRLINAEVTQDILETVNNVFVVLAEMIEDEINQTLSPLAIDYEAILGPEANVESGINLTDVYAFDNHSSSLYNDPRTNLDALFSETAGLQGIITKAEIYLWSGITSYANEQIAEIYQDAENHIITFNNFSMKALNTNSLLTKGLAGLQKLGNFGDKYDIVKTAYEKQITNFIAQIEDSNADLKNTIDIFNGFPFKYRVQYRDLYNAGTLMAVSSAILMEAFLEIGRTYVLINKYIVEGSLYMVKTVHQIVNGDNFIGNSINLLLKLSSIPKKINDIVEAVFETKEEIEKFKESVDLFAKNSKFLKKGMKIFKKLAKVAPWIEGALFALDIIMSIIDFFRAKYEQVYYYFDLPNGERLIWNGGEKKTQFWITSTTYGIDDLTLNNPIRITVPHNAMNTSTGGDASNFYFDGRFYDSLGAAYVDAMNTIMRYQTSAELQIMLNSLFKDVEVINHYKFNIPNHNGPIYWQKEDLEGNIINPAMNDPNNTFLTLSDMKNLMIYGKDSKGNFMESFEGKNRPILKRENGKFYLDKESKYLATIWITSEGYTENQADAINEYIDRILSDIEKIYIFHLPENIGNELVVQPYGLPYPYYSVGSNSIEKLDEVASDPNANNRVIYNPNIKKDNGSGEGDDLDIGTELDPNEIINTIMTNYVFPHFSVKSKKATLESTLKSKKFSEISETKVQQIIYKAHSPMGEVKYFWTINAARAWLKSNAILNAHAVNQDEFKILYLYIGISDELVADKEFSTIEELLKWLLEKNIIEILN